MSSRLKHKEIPWVSSFFKYVVEIFDISCTAKLISKTFFLFYEKYSNLRVEFNSVKSEVATVILIITTHHSQYSLIKEKNSPLEPLIEYMVFDQSKIGYFILK